MSDYLAYLESPEWWAKRKEALRRANYQCERQTLYGARHDSPLEVHHRTYQRLGDESLDDLEVLCTACHRDQHRIRNRKRVTLEHLGQERLFDRWDDEDADDTTKDVA